MTTNSARETLEQLLAYVEAAVGWVGEGPQPALLGLSAAELAYLRDLCQRGLAEPAKVVPPIDGACYCSDHNSAGIPCPPGTCPNRPPIDGDRVVAEAAIWAEVSREARGMSRTVPCPIERTAMVNRCADALSWLLNIDARAKEGG